MLFSREILVPPATPRDAPLRELVDITNGVIRRVWIRWRRGVGWLGGCQLWQGGVQRWPLTLGEFFPSFHEPIEFETWHPVLTEPYTLEIRAFNLDDTYSHRLWVAVLMERAEVTREAQEFISWITRRAPKEG
jgi:hypothetical protein